MKDDIVSDLPPYVRTVLSAIAHALGERPLSPEAILLVSPLYRDCFPEHSVRVEHTPRPPKGTRPRLKAVYALFITGPRIDGRWGFTPGQFSTLLRDNT